MSESKRLSRRAIAAQRSPVWGDDRCIKETEIGFPPGGVDMGTDDAPNTLLNSLCSSDFQQPELWKRATQSGLLMESASTSAELSDDTKASTIDKTAARKRDKLRNLLRIRSTSQL